MTTFSLWLARLSWSLYQVNSERIKSSITCFIDQLGILVNLVHSAPDGLVSCSAAIFLAHFCEIIRDNRTFEKLW